MVLDNQVTIWIKSIKLHLHFTQEQNPSEPEIQMQRKETKQEEESMDAFLFDLDIRELTMIQNPKIIKQKINKFDYVKIKKITRQKRYKQSQKTIHKTVIYMTNGYYINKILKT